MRVPDSVALVRLAAGASILFLISTNSAFLVAQVDDASVPGVEVASIKPTGPYSGRVMLRFMPGGLFQADGITTGVLIQQAYDISDFQISGPAWLEQETYTILAKAPISPRLPTILNLNLTPRAAEEEQMRLRLQSLLKDRFQMTYHREIKEQPQYSLIVAKGGSKLEESLPGQDGPPDRLTLGRGQLVGSSIAIPFLVRELSRRLGRPVIDNTGLRGQYNFKLEWAPDAAELPGG